jgi:Dimerisation domain/O-methyltransferase domain
VTPGPAPASQAAPDPPALARSQLARSADGFLTTQLLYVAAKLGVADALAGGPRTGPEIAAAVGADPDALTRALRWLVLEEVLAERAAEQPAVIRMDLYMLVLLGARERTEAQFRRLLSDSGFDVRRVVATASPAGLSVIEAAPAAPRR